MQIRFSPSSGEAKHSRDQAELPGDFGNVSLLKEGVREIWIWASLQRLSQDIRYGWRTLRSNLLFTSMAIVSLALRIGANTAIYSVMDAIVLRAFAGQKRRRAGYSPVNPGTCRE
jgi:hypothetical protein